MKVLRIAAVLLALVAAFGGGYWFRSSKGGTEKGGRKVLYWVDPMHPAYKSDKPGIAPDCGMKLEPVYAGGAPAQESAAERKVLHYRDPHDHDYTSDKPGFNPETGNELEPVYEGDAGSMPPGTVEISPEKQQLIGVRYGMVEMTRGGVRTIRAQGKVTLDERRVDHVHTKIEGWIDRVYVDFTGQLVKKGQPLLTIYSPELLASQRELLLAAKSKGLMRHSTLPGAIDHSQSLFEAARRRLELWDMSDEQIDEVIRTGKPVKNVTLYAPMGGYVLERKAFAGQKITPESELYTLADLSRVWIMADVFEYEGTQIHSGQSARVTMPYNPGRAFNARVNYIQPQVDPMTRTIKVRLEVDNPGLGLKPEMYVAVDFRVASAAALTVPAEAVLDAGERKTVFVDRGNGFLEPREVETGDSTGDRVVILRGLKAGERIVTSGNFLIDSESQLKAAASGMSGHQHD